MDAEARIFVQVDGERVSPDPIVVGNVVGACLEGQSNEEDALMPTESVESKPDNGEAAANDASAGAGGQDDAAAAAAAVATVTNADGQDNGSAVAAGESSKEHALTEAERAAQDAAAEEEAKEKQAIETFKRAQLAVQVAKQNLLAANAAMDIPPALSKEFVKTFFPFDPSDGHYEICVVCGIGGDILCCETCANVAHTYCAGLAKVPEGDWHCRECIANGKGPSKSEASADKTDAKSCDSSLADADVGEEADATTGTLKDKSVPPEGGEDGPDASSANEQAEAKKNDQTDTEEAHQDTGGAQPSKDSADEPLALDADDADGADVSDKKVSFEEASGDIGPSDSAANADKSANDPPGNWPIEENRFNEEFDEKLESLEKILHELKSLRQKRKSASQAKPTEEEKKADDDDDGDDDGSAGSDPEQDSSPRRRRGGPTQVVKRARRKKALLEVGTMILKEFEGHGDFEGRIEAVPDSDDEHQEYYRVRYHDGDEEDMSEDEAHACVEYWKENEAKKEPDDPTVRKRRKPKRFETVQAAAELKKKGRQKGDGGKRSPSRGRQSFFKECAVEGCTKQSQGRSNNDMCRRHFTQTQRKFGLHSVVFLCCSQGSATRTRMFDDLTP